MGLETDADVEVGAYTLGVVEAVGVFVSVILLEVETALLVGIGHHVAVVEYVVDVEVDVEAYLAVDINQLANRGIEGKGVLDFILG